jgi:diacylglycerol kinase (ATP)
MRAKLIINPNAGATRPSPIKIVDVIHEMQTCNLVPEAYLVDPGCDLPKVVKDALEKGFRMFVVCSGDGTISAVARTLAGTRATLGVIPIGTQNNTAFSLGIPADIPDAIAILRTGRQSSLRCGFPSR